MLYICRSDGNEGKADVMGDIYNNLAVFITFSDTISRVSPGLVQ